MHDRHLILHQKQHSLKLFHQKNLLPLAMIYKARNYKANLFYIFLIKFYKMYLPNSIIDYLS